MLSSFKIAPWLLLICLTACSQAPSPTQNNASDDADFVGCYTINKDAPAQIKISKNADKYTMQIKEPKGAKTLWDNPEPLLKADTIEHGWEFFRVNSLDFSQSDTQAILMRPDKMMALAKVKDASQNINPKLDSAFVVHIFGAVNTIYAVKCDDVQIDIVK